MPQLVGSQCVICEQKISSVLDAVFCSECGNPNHKECLKGGKKGSAGSCSKCGGDRSQAPKDETPSNYNPVPFMILLLPLAIILIGAITYFATDPNSSTANKEDEMKTFEISLPQEKENEKNRKTETREASDLPVVDIETTMGTIKVQLFAKRAPITTENFLDLVKQNYYDGIIFHRVIKDFMIQTGDPLGTGTGGRTDKDLPFKFLKDEFHPDLRHDQPGILSMANAGPNTGDTQFFITTGKPRHLDDKHAIFGKVIDGMDVVRKIENTPTGQGDRPLDPPKILTMKLLTKEKKEAPQEDSKTSEEQKSTEEGEAEMETSVKEKSVTSEE